MTAPIRSFSKDVWSGGPQIILGVDIGATHSAVSFTRLFKGGPQTVHRVTEWPGQKAQKGESKIPTLVYYDSQHQAVCFGAEALQPEMLDRAEDEGWSLAQHFKLHLHPHSMRTQDNLTLLPLPSGVSLEKIYADFLGYLLKHTQTFFETHIIDGGKIWQECIPNILVVLAHPNGWTIREQHFLRQAMRKVQSEYSNSCRIWFVAEAEASVHFCILHSDMEMNELPDTDLIVCDAGGSTIDTTAYHVEETIPVLRLEERKASACVPAGGILVDLECRRYLTKLLANANLDPQDVEEYVGAGVQDFEQTTKKEFDSPEVTHYISFCNSRLTLSQLRIRRGRMVLDSSTIESFFDKCVSEIVTSVTEQMSGLHPKHLLLVGGFGESLYLRRKLSAAFAHNDCQMTVIGDSTAKAAADGAVIWATKQTVVGQATRVSYGTEGYVTHDRSDPGQAGRVALRRMDGCFRVHGGWAGIVDEGVVLEAQETPRRKFYKSYTHGHTPTSAIACPIWAFHGRQGNGRRWIWDTDGTINPGFEKLCTVEVDVGIMRHTVKHKKGEDGPYDELEFFLAIEFGGTELSAYIEWKEKGILKSGPASIIPEPVNFPESNNKSW